MMKSAVLGVLLFVGACAEQDDHGTVEPAGPRAFGMIDLAPGIALDGYIGVTSVLYAPGASEPRSSRFFELPETWPMAFGAGGGIGTGDTGDYLVRAWLSRAKNETVPTAGAPLAETTVFIECHFGCDGAYNVLLLLQPPQ